MTDDTPTYRFYGELAAWWPLISPVEEYAEEADYAADLLRTAAIAVTDVLELGSGGGHNAAHLKAHFSLTLVDLSPDMLEVSRVINPECTHLQADLRQIRLDRQFDAVFVHDAIDYMVNEQDLRAAIETAFVHCRPGGVAVFMPDQTREIYEDDTDCGGHDGADGRAVRFMDWTWDPDPTDDAVQTEYTFVLRDADGSTRSVHESHVLGVFRRDTWLRLLREAGFDARRLTEETADVRIPRDVFVAHRPLDSAAAG